MKAFRIAAFVGAILVTLVLASCDTPTEPTSGWYFENKTDTDIYVQITYNYGTVTGVTVPAHKLVESPINYYGSMDFVVKDTSGNVLKGSTSLYISSYGYSLEKTVWDGTSLTSG